MKFISKDELVLVKLKPVKSKAGNDLCFVTLADSKTYENMEFMQDANGKSFMNCTVGNKYRVVLNQDGRYQSISLYDPSSDGDLPFDMSDKSDKK